MLNKNPVVDIYILFDLYTYLFVRMFAKPLRSHNCLHVSAYVCVCVYVQAEAARESKQSPMVQRNSSFATSHEVWKYINELGISKVDPEGHGPSQRSLVCLVRVLAAHVPLCVPRTGGPFHG